MYKSRIKDDETIEITNERDKTIATLDRPNAMQLGLNLLLQCGGLLQLEHLKESLLEKAKDEEITNLQTV